MRHFIVLAALLSLTACGSEMPSEESTAAEDTVSAEALCNSGNAWECACAKNKTQETCRTSLARCVWSVNRCLPTYE